MLMGIGKSEKTVQSNRLADQVRKKDRKSALIWPLGLKTLLYTFTILWLCPVKKKLCLVDLTISYMSKRTYM